MTSLKPQFQNCPDLSSLKHRHVLSVTLATSYIANGRIVSSDQLEVWVLDNSEMVETLRSQPVIDFEVGLSDAMCLRGSAFAELGVSRTGENRKRYVEVILTLEQAYQEPATLPGAIWAT